MDIFILVINLLVWGHYPAIDILQSISRVFPKVTSLEHRKAAGEVREMLGKLEQLQLYLDLGEYREGENVDNDRALAKQTDIEMFLKQGMEQPESSEDILTQLNRLVS